MKLKSKRNMSSSPSTIAIHTTNAISATPTKFLWLVGTILLVMTSHLSFDFFNHIKNQQHLEKYEKSQFTRKKRLNSFGSPLVLGLSVKSEMDQTVLLKEKVSVTSSILAGQEKEQVYTNTHNHHKEIRNNDDSVFVPNRTFSVYKTERELHGRNSRFPSIEDRVKTYMTNWYLPPCDIPKNRDQFIQFKFIEDNTTSFSEIDFSTNEAKLRIREIPILVSGANINQTQKRSFMISDDTGNSIIHYMNLEKMMKCKVESCVDIIQYWYPAIERIANQLSPSEDQQKYKYNLNHLFAPFLFQFGDHVLSKAYQLSLSKFDMFPAMPHLKKSRESIKISSQVSTNSKKFDYEWRNSKYCCYKGPLQAPETVRGQREHLQPSKFIQSLLCRRERSKLFWIMPLRHAH
jgi:hypothetical protein